MTRQPWIHSIKNSLDCWLHCCTARHLPSLCAPNVGCEVAQNVLATHTAQNVMDNRGHLEIVIVMQHSNIAHEHAGIFFRLLPVQKSQGIPE
jgi:hypothetical protein